VPSAAVGGSPSATDGENFAVCLLSLCRVLGAHGELANSGSGVLSTSWLEICIAQNGILITYGNNFETDLLKLRILPRIRTWIC